MYHLSQYYLTMGDAEKSYQYHQDVSGYIGQVFASYGRQARDNAFKELKLTTEIDALKISRQQQVIVIVSLLFVLSLVSATRLASSATQLSGDTSAGRTRHWL